MDNIIEKYRILLPAFESYTKRLHELLETILETSRIKYHLVESRTKSLNSYTEKINSKGGKYKNPIEEITDICGLRIIVFYIDDLDKIDKLLRDNFSVDSENSFNAKHVLSDDQFGYVSSHYVVTLSAERNNLLEWKTYKGYKAEIQVRTVLQHAWAAISHELEYKKTYDIPSVLKRKLFRLAGLIELADEEFQEAKEKHQIVELSIKDKSLIDEIKVYDEINLNTLNNYFDFPNSDLIEVEKTASDAGFKIWSKDLDGKMLSDIIEVCQLKRINTIDELNKFIRASLGTAYSEFHSLVKLHKGWGARTDFLILLLLIVTLDERLLDEYDGKGWSRNIWEPVKDYIKKRNSGK